MRARFVRLLTVAAWTLASGVCAARAEDEACDALALARLAEQEGHALLLARLGTGDRARALVGVRASAFAEAPELLVPALARLACGRDAVLATEAAHVIVALAARLQPSELAAREVLVSDLARARVALACARAVPVPRADIAASLQAAEALLATLP